MMGVRVQLNWAHAHAHTHTHTHRAHSTQHTLHKTDWRCVTKNHPTLHKTDWLCVTMCHCTLTYCVSQWACKQSITSHYTKLIDSVWHSQNWLTVWTVCDIIVTQSLWHTLTYYVSQWVCDKEFVCDDSLSGVWQRIIMGMWQRIVSVWHSIMSVWQRIVSHKFVECVTKNHECVTKNHHALHKTDCVCVTQRVVRVWQRIFASWVCYKESPHTTHNWLSMCANEPSHTNLLCVTMRVWQWVVAHYYFTESHNENESCHTELLCAKWSIKCV